MRAAGYERTGTAREVLQVLVLPDPTPSAGEVRVRVHSSGVNPSDVKSRAGIRSKTLPFPRVIPHSDGAGVIDAVGPDVPASRIGERVWIWNAAWGRPHGTAAELVVLPTQQAVHLPDNVEFDAGACLGIPALTAYHAVHTDGGVSGKSVLVAGGAGAVGHYAIQFAKAAGAAQVLTTVSTAEKSALARAAGADVVINYRTDDVVARVHEATGGRGVDRIIEVDFGVNIGLDTQIVRADGEIVVYGSNAPEIAVPFVPMILKNVGLRFFIVYNLSAQARSEALEGLNALLAAGKLIHNIGARIPLDHIADAHEMIENGQAVGNVVVSLR
jgi:NADPH2:quinone reductase